MGTLRCVLKEELYSCSVSLYRGIQIYTGKFNPGGTDFAIDSVASHPGEVKTTLTLRLQKPGYA